MERTPILDPEFAVESRAGWRLCWRKPGALRPNGTTARRAGLMLALCAIVSWLGGCGQKDLSSTKPASSSETNSVLQAELDQVNELALEPNPEKRSRVLSQPAASRREWMLQALLQGYRATGKTSPGWDASVQSAFEAFAEFTRGSGSWPALRKALSAVAPACEDPMIQYLRVRYREEAVAPASLAQDFLKVHDALLRSQHHPLFKFMAGLRADASVREVNGSLDRGRRLAWTTASLEDLARDTNAPADEVFETANFWLEHSHAKAWIDYVTQHLDPVLEANWGKGERWLRFEGRAEIRRAWGDRGGGYANKVTRDGWEGFKEHLEKAEEFLTKAWEMNSKSTETAYLMMRVELGQGQGRPRMDTWFNRAMLLDTNFYDAASLMSFYLEPRWYGSTDEALEFGRACASSERWGGRVPLVLVDLHYSLAKYENQAEAPAYWQRTEVWNDVKSAYEQFFKRNPNEIGYRHNYARDANKCGQYSVFLEQVRRFTEGTNYTYFGGRDKFQEMLSRAASAADVPLK